jgi:hypothetical protein
MRKSSRVFFYLLLNIIISAGTVLAVLWFWERTHPASPMGEQGSFLLEAENTSSSIKDASSVELVEDTAVSFDFVTDEIQVDIHTIVGAGNLEVEYVEIHNQSQGPVDMTKWQIKDQDGQAFVFPPLILNQGGAVKVLSKKGNNTVIELYWQSEAPIWHSGETASLLNSDGETIATYSIP